MHDTAKAGWVAGCDTICWVFGISAAAGHGIVQCLEAEGHYPATPHKTTISFSRPAGTFTITWTEEAA